MGERTVVLGVIGADVHAVGLRILDYALRSAGFDVVNIGVLSSQEDFIKAAIESDARAILVSSLYGHAELDCRGFREKLQEAGLDNVLLYIGGNLGIGQKNWEEVEKKFKELGFNRVYPPKTMPDEVIRDLKKDLGLDK
uniref:Glutamate mutase sigma subunit n=1 Tax=Dictyoglomus thermophilum TaxID=14 RepID=A0A7C3RWT9_DICTH